MSRAFTDVLRDLRGGTLAEELTEDLAKLAIEVDKTGKQGTISVQLTVKPASKGSGTMVVTDKTSLKLPELAKGETIMFGSPEGSLTRSDPNQKKLDLKPVDTTPVPLKQAV